MADLQSSEQICRDFIINYAKENDYDSDFKLSRICTEGANYTTHLFIITLTKNGETVEVFAKVAAVGEKIRDQNPIPMYETENYFYTKIRKIYHDLEEKNNIPEELRLRLPKFYACTSKLYEETIVLENLAAKGFTTHDRLKPVDWEYASASMTELAKFHALSMAYQKTDPEEYEKEKVKLKVDFVKGPKHQAYFESIVKNALSVTREENKEKLERFMDGYLVNCGFLKNVVPIKRSVITHGDYRPSNLMHKQLEDGSYEMVPVDLQTIQVGCPVIDVLYFIFTSTDGEFRNKYYQRLIDHYYSRLSKALQMLGMDPDETYSREDFDFELKEKMPYGLSMAVCILPIVTVEAKDAPKVDQEMDLASFAVMINEELFPQRLNDIIDDYIRWGILT